MFATTRCIPEQTKVVLLYGGRSNERDISILSGNAVEQALLSLGFPTVKIDAKDPDYIEQMRQAEPDVVFNCLHGKGGEDGCVQGVCHELDLPIIGSGVLASALAMDKTRAKIIYAASGISTPKSMALNRGESASYSDVSAALGAKIVVKAAHEGSAIGTYIVDSEAAFDEAVKAAFDIDSLLVIEQFISGTEVTVAVLGNDELEALPIIEIVPHSDFYDFEAKYAAGGSDHICPARIPDDVAKRCQEQAVLAHRALGCRGLSRTDMIIDSDGTPWTLETNTIPGMTATSLIPDAARAVGISFEDLCRLLIELALESASE